jgi:ABC-type uncharacterized transport system substrate-binding protein
MEDRDSFIKAAEVLFARHPELDDIEDEQEILEFVNKHIDEFEEYQKVLDTGNTIKLSNKERLRVRKK